MPYGNGFLAELKRAYGGHEMKTVKVEFEVHIPDDMDIDDAEEWIGFEVGANRQMTPVHPQMEKDLEPIHGSFSVR